VKRASTTTIVSTDNQNAEARRRRPFGGRRVLDPRRCNICFDANALDRDGTANDQLIDLFLGLASAGDINVVVAGGVRAEVQHPRTPDEVKAAFLPQIFNLRPGLIPAQIAERNRVRIILQGYATPGRHSADASHLSEASETGCSYFITNDKRILKKRDELHAVLPPTLTIVTLAEVFEIFDDFEAGRRL
jgi:hypothetical protein